MITPGSELDAIERSELLADRKAERRYLSQLSRHPDPRDPDYPGPDEDDASRAPERLGGIYITATNGHVLAIIHDKDGTLEGREESIIFKINPDLLRACKAKPLAGMEQKVLVTGHRVTVAPDFDMIGTDCEQYAMRKPE